MTKARVAISFIRAAIAAIAMASSGAAIAQTADLPAQEPAWRIRSGVGQCVLVGHLSPDTAHLYVQTIPGTDYYRIALSGKEMLPGTAGHLVRLGILFNGGNPRFDRLGTSTALPNKLGILIQLDGIDADVITALAQASSISMEVKCKATAPLLFWNADKAVVALDACIGHQLVAWGADPKQFEPGGAKPVALVSRDDWIPNSTLLGLTRFTDAGRNELDAVLRISVTEDGHVDGCARVEGPADAAFEKEACAPVLNRQLFKPGHDSSGKAVRGAAAFEIRLMTRPG